MGDYYFTKLPTIVYNDVRVRDITKRAFIQANTIARAIQFYPYEIKSGTRSDLVSYAYYGDPYLDWLIYLANGIQDPLGDWYLSEDDFQKFIVKKYGSYEDSTQYIKHYELNWSNSDLQISPGHFANTIPENLKKYYAPVFGQGARVQAYKRREESWKVITNQILDIEVELNSDEVFANGELVNIKVAGELVGRAEIIVCNTSHVICKNISGNTSDNTALVLGLTSSANANLLETVVLDVTIPDEEFSYWTPVTMYEWERARNETNKNVYLLDSEEALQASEDIRKALK